MKYTRRRHQTTRRRRNRHRSRQPLKRHRPKSAYRRKYNTRRKYRHRRKQSGGDNGLVQLGYNAGRGMTSTITNFINTYVGNAPSASPQATKSQYHAYT